MALSAETKWEKLTQFLEAKEVDLIGVLKRTSRSYTVGAYDCVIVAIPPQLAMLDEIRARVEQLNRGEEAPKVQPLPPKEKY